MEACLAFRRVLWLIESLQRPISLCLLLLQSCFPAQACLFLAFLLSLLLLQRLLLGLGVSIDKVHGCIDVLGNPYLNSFDRPVLARGEQDTLIAWRRTQDIVRPVHALLAGAANAHTQARELVGMQVANNAL